MVSARGKPQQASVRAIFLSILMVTGTLFISTAMADDTDGDGTDDSIDDCPVAFGNSTLDRTGCPDRDGDGTSDLNDPWVMSTGGYLEVAHQSSNDDHCMVRFNYDASQYATAENSGGGQGDPCSSSGGSSDIRIWDTATRNNLRTIQVSERTRDIDWSPDGLYVAVYTSDEEVRIYDASDGSLYGTMDANGENAGELEFSPDGTMLAVTGSRSGNSGDGQIEIFDVDTASSTYGDVIQTLNPGSTVYYYSVDWSPDGSRLVVGGYEAIYIIDTDTWGENRTISNAFNTLNSVHYSPDGNMISGCSAYDNGGARARVYDAMTGAQMWSYTTSTSCVDATWSPDSSQVAFSMKYYQADGSSIHLFFATTGVKLDTLYSGSGSPGSCGNGNGCGEIWGVDWHPDGNYIISAQTRNDEGVYHWILNPDMDNDGYLNPDDAFPEDGTQWNDTDGDNYGDNPAPATEPDSCPDVFGTSYMDVFGCPDMDGDGYSDNFDMFDDDPYQWSDNDGDGYPSNTNDPRDPSPYGSVDHFDENPTQWSDFDGDGYGDNYANASWTSIRPAAENIGQLLTMTPSQLADVDTFPLNPEQWNDTDGDWIGDEPFTSVSDGCPLAWGNSVWDRMGCPDSDGDGYSDPGNGAPGEGLASPAGDADAFWDNPTQWHDSDGDGYGDNKSGTMGDECPGKAGTSQKAIQRDSADDPYYDIDYYGCDDNDGDGYANVGEAFPNDPTQYKDTDGDGYDRNNVESSCGDNPNGNNPDLFPTDGTQCGDRDGDGYGDNPSGPNGDWFPDDSSQWWDTDGDGFGDNPLGNMPDICPNSYGDITTPEARGCPDFDDDGVPDPLDDFWNDTWQSSDVDGDGWGDNPGFSNSDDCVGWPGTSYLGIPELNIQPVRGCTDTDGDGYADSIDMFFEDPTQWVDTDGDGWGDNYSYENVTGDMLDNETYLWNCDVEPENIQTRIQNGDAFPDEPTQWSDTDGDGFGDNYKDNTTTRLDCWPGVLVDGARESDALPLRLSQQSDPDRDGFGDNDTANAFQGDRCPSQYGTSYLDRFGCQDSDGDGTSDTADACPYDADYYLIEDNKKCKADSSGSQGEDEGSSMMMYIMGGIIALMLSLIFVALVAKQMGARKRLSEIRDMQAQEMAFNDEEQERRQKWIDHYVSTGEIEKAKELGYVEKAEWQVHMEQEAAEKAALPSLDDLLD